MTDTAEIEEVIDKKELERTLDKTKIDFLSRPDAVFFATVLFSLKFHWTDQVPTAATDGMNLYVNPRYFMDLDERERVGLFFHEVGHVILFHMTRLGTRNPNKWNYAGDYVINLMAQDAGYTLPSGGLIDEYYRDMSTEEVYDAIDDDVPEDFDQDIIYVDADGLKAVEEAVADAVQKGVIAAKQAGDKAAGSIPGSVEAWLDELHNPVLPWYSILLNYFDGWAPNDYSYRRFNRKFLPDMYMPTLYSESVGNVVTSRDVSGSISDKDLVDFSSEIDGIIEGLHPETTTVIEFDTQIQKVSVLEDGDTIADIKTVGRGGTDVNPVFDWINTEMDDEVKVLIIFTDGYFSIPQHGPPYDVVWIIVDNPNFQPGFGEVIHYNPEK